MNEKQGANGTEKGKSRRERLKKYLKRGMIVLQETFFPTDYVCELCRREKPSDGCPVCHRCREDLPFLKENYCHRCGAYVGDESDFCNNCAEHTPLFTQGASVFSYEGGAKRLLLKYKEGRGRYLADWFAELLIERAGEMGWSADCLTYVPMTAQKRRRRGFNQAEVLAKKMGERTDLPVLPLLEKVKDPPHAQKELSKEERLENLKGCFVCPAGESLKGMRILLIDDVKTTGATAEECARVLFKKRAAEVLLLTLCSTRPKITWEEPEEGEKPENAP